MVRYVTRSILVFDCVAKHRSKRIQASGHTSEVCLLFPEGFDLSDEDSKALIANWIVPQLIQMFVSEASTTLPADPDITSKQ
jgi:hypothetical protein